jgi:hypothetical protein
MEEAVKKALELSLSDKAGLRMVGCSMLIVLALILGGTGLSSDSPLLVIFGGLLMVAGLISWPLFLLWIANGGLEDD